MLLRVAFCLLGVAVSTSALPPNLAQTARLSATTSASKATGKYGLERLRDSLAGTHWASAAKPPLPQSITLEWDEPVTFDVLSVNIFARRMANLYASWQQFEIHLDGTLAQSVDLPPDEDFAIVRLPEARTARVCELRVTAVVSPKTYLGINELGVYLDTKKQIHPPRKMATRTPRESLQVLGRTERPCVYFTPADVTRAQRNATNTEWGREEKAKLVAAAAKWLARSDEEWLAYLPPPGACYAYGFTGCPICGSSLGTWASTRCSWDIPGKVSCPKGHVLPNAECPDDGTGFKAEDGRFHYLVGSWNSWVTEQWTRHAIPTLAHAYALTGDEKYAERAAFFLDALASIYPESTAGSWDYPSRPPSGRFARPWYQVSRNLVVYIEAYDLLYTSPAFRRPSLRPRLEATFPAGATAQSRAVRTKDAYGYSKPGMTRRENVDRNLVLDGAWYCYQHTFAGKLHNGHADYMRGALAAGALLGIEPFVENAVTSPYSIYAMLQNNLDRDGRYYETALGYALHTRNLYLTFVEPLKNWRSASRPQGVDLFANARMRRFYRLPELEMGCAGHNPNFGDAGPDPSLRFPRNPPYSRTDYNYAERLLAHTTGKQQAEAAQLVGFLADGNVEKARRAFPAKRWLLYHAEPVLTAPDGPDFTKELAASHLFGQKGIAILRDGDGEHSQAAFLRFGPSLNHGDLDDLGLIYYAKGRQMLYEIGYGLGSTHTQVGWGTQTASHAIVTVDEASQKGGSGGSLRLFAALPGLKLVEAESPLGYESRGVTLYRRTVALLGSAENQVLVDLFRVQGGSQHDYGFGVQTRNATVTGLELGPEQSGSLAEGVAWGERLGRDGDVQGFPNKPYWNPPPGNGYGFFFDPRHAVAAEPFVADFVLGGRNDARLRVHALPEPGTEAILAKGPGLYPHNPAATYLLLRRKADAPLASTFATVYEPTARARGRAGIGRLDLEAKLVDSNAETKQIPGLGVLLLKGSKAGDFMEFAVDAPATGIYQVAADILRAHSYGTTQVLVDGKPLGKPYVATHATIDGPHRILFGQLQLQAGTHRIRFQMAGEDAFFLGIASLIVALPEQVAEPTEATPLVEWAKRLAVQSSDPTACGTHLRHLGRDEILLSASGNGPHRAETCFGPVSWQGSVVLLGGRKGRLETVSGIGAGAVRVANQAVGPPAGGWTGTIQAIDYDRHTVEIQSDQPLPDTLGSVARVSNPAYSRTTGYRIHGLRALGPKRFLLDLGDQSPILGHGRVHQLASDTSLKTDVPHEYARSVVGGADSRFFDGKTIRNDAGATTRIKRLRFGAPMALTVQSTEGFAEGDRFTYLDLAPGDQLHIPAAWQIAIP